MPFINVKTNAKLSDSQKEVIKRRLFDCIGILPGKSDRYLMIAVDDGMDMAFHRDSETPMAIVKVKIFGGSTKDAYQKLTKAVCLVMSDEVSVSGEYCYVTYEEISYWGYNGFMF